MSRIPALVMPAVISTLLLVTGPLVRKPVAADELQVRAPVINVEALKEPATEIEYCDGHPGEAAGLIDLLSWDLGLGCERELVESTSISGYRVSYRWDDRVYSQILDRDPGSSIALKVRLD